MKKLAFLLAMVLGVTNMNAQDYDLQGLAKACEEYSTDDSLYPTMSSFHDGLAAVSKDGKWGYIDKKGILAIPLQYDMARDFREGKAAVLIDGKWGYREKDGSFLIQPRFTDALDFKDGMAFVGDTFIDPSGIPMPIEIMGSGHGEYAPYFSEGLACVMPTSDNPESKCGYINERGQIKISCKFDNAFNFKDGVACVGIDDRYGYIDVNSRTVVPMIYDDFYISHYCSDGLIRVAKKGDVMDQVWGYVNKSGRTVIPCKFYDASDFSEGVAFVEELSSDYSSKWTGFIDTNGNKLVQCNYTFEKGFQEGMCVLSKDEKYSYLNKSFQLIAPFEFDLAESFSEGLALVKIGDKWGYIDRQGRNTFNPTAITNTNTNSTTETTESLEKEVKTMWDEANKYIDLANSSETKGEKLNYIKKADALYEKIQNTPNVESVLPLDYIKQYRDTCKQFIEALNAM